MTTNRHRHGQTDGRIDRQTDRQLTMAIARFALRTSRGKKTVVCPADSASVFVFFPANRTNVVILRCALALCVHSARGQHLFLAASWTRLAQRHVRVSCVALFGSWYFRQRTSADRCHFCPPLLRHAISECRPSRICSLHADRCASLVAGSHVTWRSHGDGDDSSSSSSNRYCLLITNERIWYRNHMRSCDSWERCIYNDHTLFRSTYDNN